eukprot:TRINITY_DN10186_c0_g2_i1.p1 TRINITY_DN10186_c0_g2~~TRINITY_DN10186_c0_g2_i1.p1  ORF type:complete len:312 (+),score=79.99 TRINITY_DN10186_c0_g2_i1:158-1093(+)
MDAIRGMPAGGATNPFHVSTVPHLYPPEATRPAAAQEAWSLAETYRRMLDIVGAMQALLEMDQESLALLLREAHAAQNPELDVKVFLLQEGIELRLRELEEECRRLASVELRLQRAIDEAEAECEIEAIREAGLVDPRLLEKLLDQRKVIKLQQEELDQMKFERDVLLDDAARLREDCEAFGEGDEFGDGGLDVFTQSMDAVQAAEHYRDQGSPREQTPPHSPPGASPPGIDLPPGSPTSPSVTASPAASSAARWPPRPIPRRASNSSRRGSQETAGGVRRFNFGQAARSSAADADVPYPLPPGMAGGSPI